MYSVSKSLFQRLQICSKVRNLRTENVRLFSLKQTSVNTESILSELGLTTGLNNGVFNGKEWFGNGEVISTFNPSNNEKIADVKTGNSKDYELCLDEMAKAKEEWALTPPPVRGQVVRTIGDMLRDKKSALGRLVTLENGKIVAEGEGEVQEAIDICDYAVGLSRMYNGQVLPSERFGHCMYEYWNPLNGHVGLITAFNFPVAVAFWNLSLSLVCGNTNIWKGASTVPLVTIACGKIIENALREHNINPSVVNIITGSGKEVGNKFGIDDRLELVSFTGSTNVGKNVNIQIAERFGKSIMELGGNNGLIVMDDADINMAVDACFFAAVGTCGQRCTSLRRLFLHESIYDSFLNKLLNKYKTIKIGDPLRSDTLCGPMINQQAVQDYENGINTIKKSSKSKILYGGKVLDDMKGNFVEPTIVETEHTEAFVNEELFAPVLYVMKFKTYDEVVKMHNNVIHGLSSSLFTKSHSNIFKWLGPTGSDCGIVNVNIGTSGAEIGGAFGGNKYTGNGRESGSDSWKQYCRQSTCTINYSDDLPLAQGINFGSDD